MCAEQKHKFSFQVFATFLQKQTFLCFVKAHYNKVPQHYVLNNFLSPIEYTKLKRKLYRKYIADVALLEKVFLLYLHN